MMKAHLGAREALAGALACCLRQDEPVRFPVLEQLAEVVGRRSSAVTSIAMEEAPAEAAVTISFGKPMLSIRAYFEIPHPLSIVGVADRQCHLRRRGGRADQVRQRLEAEALLAFGARRDVGKEGDRDRGHAANPRARAMRRSLLTSSSSRCCCRGVGVPRHPASVLMNSRSQSVRNSVNATH